MVNVEKKKIFCLVANGKNTVVKICKTLQNSLGVISCHQCLCPKTKSMCAQSYDSSCSRKTHQPPFNHWERHVVKGEGTCWVPTTLLIYFFGQVSVHVPLTVSHLSSMFPSVVKTVVLYKINPPVLLLDGNQYTIRKFFSICYRWHSWGEVNETYFHLANYQKTRFDFINELVTCLYY